MIHDAQLEVTCDGKGCTESVLIQPSFVYPNYSGRDGRYDTSDAAIEEKLPAAGWSVKDGKHYCESCGEEAR